MAEVLVVKSKVKELAAGKGFRFAGDAVDALSNCVATKIEKAGERAKANGRKTIKGYDI